jgi:D-beta-D-heptose 7-phosphate kinase/D-beta-D-heptose 1-phosphate adenosyltransferase
MGARAFLAGVTGTDMSAGILKAELARADIDASALVEDPDRVTTTKTRITAGGQQIVRFDEEDTSPLSHEVEARLRQCCEALLASVDACVVSDYAKGVAGEPFCRWLIGAAAAAGKPVVVDPKARDLGRYRGATVITPNLKETAVAASDPIHDSAQLAHAAARLMPLIAPSALLVTQGGDGMSLFEQDVFALEGGAFRIPALPVEVADVTGAGDTVVAILAIALGMGMGLREASALANLAAGIAVRHTGTWAVNREELLADSERIHQT